MGGRLEVGVGWVEMGQRGVGGRGRRGVLREGRHDWRNSRCGCGLGQDGGKGLGFERRMAWCECQCGLSQDGGKTKRGGRG